VVHIPDRNTDVSTLVDEIGLMANMQDVLIAVQTSNKNAGATFIGTEYGVAVSADHNSVPKTLYYDPRTRVWYKNAKQANDIIWTDVYEDYFGRGLSITCSKPFYDADGRIAGVAGLSMFLVVLREEVLGTKIGETGFAFIINEKGEMIISDSIEKDEDGRIIRENMLESDTFPRETALKMINGESGIEHVVMDGKEKLIAYHGLTTVPWSLALIIDAEEVISPALMLEDNIISLTQSALTSFNRDIRYLTMLLGVIVFFTIAGVMFFSGRLAGDITGPIEKLTQDAALIGAGDLEPILVIKTGDELEILAESFNSMIVGIKTISAENERLEIASAEKTRNAEIIQEANQLKSRFLATMSHEIRTPMNVITGITEIQLQKEDNPPDTKDAFERIYESGSLLLNIINDILDFSKISEGKMEIVPFRYDIPSLINDTAQLNYLYCDSKPIEFIVLVDADTPLELVGDALRVKQILNNLLSNAFKYTDKGEVELSVFPESSSPSSDEVIIVFCVRDTGQGISEEHIDRLFEDYMRFNRDLNRSVTGTGLGLSITKRLLNLMNGEISVESQPGKGSVFTVRLPQKRCGEAVCGAENARRLREFDFNSTAITKKTQIIHDYMPYGSVLVVDDVKSNLFVARGLLAPYGLQIDTIDSGYKAVEKIRDGNVYDIIFMDHMMPVMDGIEAVRTIRGMGYDRPIVALTANALVGQAEVFMQNGFDAFITKPIDTRKLNIVLKDFIRDKKVPETVEATQENPMEKKRKLSELEECFLDDANEAINVLEGLYAKIDALGEKDIELYEVTVHGIKSALANIGETDLSDVAYKLEQVALEKNLALMSEETPDFLNALKSLMEDLVSAKDPCS
jgi:signal transduction histidine kinase/CheY-like chemotaxis protein